MANCQNHSDRCLCDRCFSQGLKHYRDLRFYGEVSNWQLKQSVKNAELDIIYGKVLPMI